MRQAIFLDRDGTLIEDRGNLRHPSEIVFFPETIPALKLLQSDFVFFIVTHQPGIAEGRLTCEEVEQVNTAVIEHLAQNGIQIKQIYYCRHKRAEGCQCIKPKPYHLLLAAREFGIDLPKSFVIGDHPHDMELARNAGATGVHVLTGHGQKHQNEIPRGALKTKNILEAARLINQTVCRPNASGNPASKAAQAVSILKNGGTVAFPTETVYGLGANALDAMAVAKIFEIKRRPRFDPLIVHVADMQQARMLVRELPANAQKLMNAFWPGPLSIVLLRQPSVPDIVTAGLPTVALRMPDHPLALELIKRTGPLAAPSANPFGFISPTTAQHVAEQLGAQVELILDGGPCRIGIESTIISLADTPPVLLRLGGIPAEAIEATIGQKLVTRPVSACPSAPGQLPQHYAPRTMLVLKQAAGKFPAAVRIGLLAFRRPINTNTFTAVETLSESGDLREAAANLFAALHRLDAMKLDLIIAEPAPETGLGCAINDRLRRASMRDKRLSEL